MNISVRLALPNEVDRFSSYISDSSSNHLIAIAISHQVPAGIGALAPLDADSCELTNLVIFTPFPRLIVAKTIIRYLLQHAVGKLIYALPFAEFTRLHQELGFTNATSSICSPVILSQLKIRHEIYGKEISLLVKDQRRLG